MKREKKHCGVKTTLLPNNSLHKIQYSNENLQFLATYVFCQS